MIADAAVADLTIELLKLEALKDQKKHRFAPWTEPSLTYCLCRSPACFCAGFGATREGKDQAIEEWLL